jgi:hypothetical protein
MKLGKEQEQHIFFAALAFSTPESPEEDRLTEEYIENNWINIPKDTLMELTYTKGMRVIGFATSLKDEINLVCFCHLGTRKGVWERVYAIDATKSGSDRLLLADVNKYQDGYYAIDLFDLRTKVRADGADPVQVCKDYMDQLNKQMKESPEVYMERLRSAGRNANPTVPVTVYGSYKNRNN